MLFEQRNHDRSVSRCRRVETVAGLPAKVPTQVVSRDYDPPSAGTLRVLATKFGYSVMRDSALSAIPEFDPDAAAHLMRNHREKMAAQGANSAP